MVTMALIVCPECKHDISDKAESCPYCGYPLAKTRLSERLNIHGGSYFGKLARGEYPLRSAFWLCFFLVFFTVNMLIYIFSGSIAPFLLPPTYETVAAVIVIFLIYAIYLLTCVVGVWRSAGRYQGTKLLATGARVFVVCYAVNSLYLTIFGFILTMLKLARLT